MFKKVNLENIVEGMILSSPQINKYGQILLAKGTKLENNHIKILKTWGIDSVTIVDEGDEGAVSDHTQRVKVEIEKSLKVRMLFEPSNIYEVDMFRAAVEHKMRAE